MLLVDDDQAEVADRGEDGGARADADAGLAAAQAAPLVEALAGGEGRVEDGEAVAEAGAEAGDGLRREADLGDEDDRAAAARERRLDRGEVDLGLAGAGDAVEELGARGAGVAVEGGDDRRRPPPAVRGGAGDARRWRFEAPSARGRGAGASRGWRSARVPRAGAGWRGRSRPRRPARRSTSPRRGAPPAPPAASPRAGSPPESAASPAGVISARSSSLARTVRPAAPVPVPGGSTSCRPREGVEQYSRATQRPSSTSSGGAPASSASSGSASRSGGSSERSASSTTTPRMRRGPNGTRTTLPTSSSSIAAGRR